MIKTKCVYSEIEPAKDGLRILATRFRGRGMPTSRYDVWMANLGPSEQLLKSFLAGRIGWSEFSRRYRKELFEGGAVDGRNRTIKNHGQKFTLRLLQKLTERGTVTLMCHCAEDQPSMPSSRATETSRGEDLGSCRAICTANIPMLLNPGRELF